MKTRYLSTLLLIAVLGACASTGYLGGVAPLLRYDTVVEYVEVGRLVASSENVLIPLGPGRSYWYDAADRSRWASEIATIPATTRVLILQNGVAYVDPLRRELNLRHVDGPRNIKQGWYGRLTQVQPGAGQALVVTLEDGRRFEVTGTAREDLPRIPFAVLVGEDAETIFVLNRGDAFDVVSELDSE
jgi:hypothetical protein